MARNVNLQKAAAKLLYNTTDYSDDPFRVCTVEAVADFLETKGPYKNFLETATAVANEINDLLNSEDGEWLHCLFLHEQDWCTSEEVSIVRYTPVCSKAPILIFTTGSLPPSAYGMTQLEDFINGQYGSVDACVESLGIEGEIKSVATIVPKTLLGAKGDKKKFVKMYACWLYFDEHKDYDRVVAPTAWSKAMNKSILAYNLECDLAAMFARMCKIHKVEVKRDSDFRQCMESIGENGKRVIDNYPERVKKLYNSVVQLLYVDVATPVVSAPTPVVSEDMNARRVEQVLQAMFNGLPSQYQCNRSFTYMNESELLDNPACCNGNRLEAMRYCEQLFYEGIPAYFIQHANYSPVIIYELAYAVQLVYKPIDLALMSYMTTMRECIRKFPTGRPFRLKVPLPKLWHPTITRRLLSYGKEMQNCQNDAATLLMLHDVNIHIEDGKDYSTSKWLVALNCQPDLNGDGLSPFAIIPVWLPSNHKDEMPLSEIQQFF